MATVDLEQNCPTNPDKFTFWFRLCNGSISVVEFEEKYYENPQSSPTSILFCILTQDDMDIFLGRIKNNKDDLLTEYMGYFNALKDGTLVSFVDLMKIFGAVLTHQLVSYGEKFQYIKDLRAALKDSPFYDENAKAFVDEINEKQLYTLGSGLPEVQTKQEEEPGFLHAILVTEILEYFFDSKNPEPSYVGYFKSIQDATCSEKFSQVCVELYMLNPEEVKEFYDKAKQEDYSCLLEQYWLAVMKFDTHSYVKFNEEDFYWMLYWMGALVTNPHVPIDEKVMYLIEVMAVVSMVHYDEELTRLIVQRRQAMLSVMEYFAANDRMDDAIDVVGVCAVSIYQERPAPALDYAECVLNGLMMLVNSLERAAVPITTVDDPIEIPVVEEKEKSTSLLTEPEIIAFFCGSGLHKGARVRFKYLKKGENDLHELLVKLEQLALQLSPLEGTYTKWVEFVDCFLKVMKFCVGFKIVEFLKKLLEFIRQKFVHFEHHQHHDTKTAYHHLTTWYKEISHLFDSCSKEHPLRLTTYCVMMVKKLFKEVESVYPHRAKYWKMLLVQLFVLILILKLCEKERLEQSHGKVESHIKVSKDEEFIFLPFISCFATPATSMAIDLSKYHNLDKIYKEFDLVLNSINQTAIKEDNEERKTSEKISLEFLYSATFVLATVLADSSFSADDKFKILLSCIDKLPDIVKALLKVESCKDLIVCAAKEVLEKYEQLHKLINHHGLNHHEHSVICFVTSMEAFYAKSRDDKINRIVILTEQLLTLLLLYLILIKFKHPHLPLPHEFTKVVEEVKNCLDSNKAQAETKVADELSET